MKKGLTGTLLKLLKVDIFLISFGTWLLEEQFSGALILLLACIVIWGYLEIIGRQGKRNFFALHSLIALLLLFYCLSGIWDFGHLVAQEKYIFQLHCHTCKFCCHIWFHCLLLHLDLVMVMCMMAMGEEWSSMGHGPQQSEYLWHFSIV